MRATLLFAAPLAAFFSGCAACGTVVAGGGEGEPATGDDAGDPGLESFAQVPTQGYVVAMAHDDASLYWLEDDTVGSREAYRIRRAPISGGAAAMLLEFDALVDGLRREATGLAVWSGEVYWRIEPGDGTCSIHAVPTAGGGQRLVFQMAGRCSKAVLPAEDGIWFGGFGKDSSIGTIYRLPWGSQVPVPIVYAENTVSVPTVFALTPRQVTFVSDEPAIFTGPRHGKNALSHRIKVGGYCDLIATDGWRTFIGASGHGTDRAFIIHVPELGEERTYYVGALHSTITDLAANSKYVFWLEDGALRRLAVSATEGDAKTLLTGNFLGLHATEQHLYLTAVDGIHRIPAE